MMDVPAICLVAQSASGSTVNGFWCAAPPCAEAIPTSASDVAAQVMTVRLETIVNIWTSFTTILLGSRTGRDSEARK